MSRAKQIILASALAIIVVIASIVALVMSTTRASATNVPPYIPRVIIVGPDSTEFIIKDESRGRTVYYYCAFLSPHNTGQAIPGTHPVQYVYVPAIQCNK